MITYVHFILVSFCLMTARHCVMTKERSFKVVLLLGLITSLTLLVTLMAVIGTAIELFGLDLSAWVGHVFTDDTEAKGFGAKYLGQFLGGVALMIPVSYLSSCAARYICSKSQSS